MPGDRSNYHRLFGELRLVTRVKTYMQQNTASQNLCDGWAKYRQNAYIVIDNPFKVVVFVRIYCQKSSYLFKNVVFISFFAIFIIKEHRV